MVCTKFTEGCTKLILKLTLDIPEFVGVKQNSKVILDFLIFKMKKK